MPKERYGFRWDDRLTDLHIELKCFRRGGTESTGGLSKAEHFKRITRIGWGPKSKKQFKWHPWAEDMLEEACRCTYLAISGCASSGKTSFLAMWGLVNWLSMPPETLVLFTSTSLKEARQRVWGDVVEYFTAFPGLPGKLVDSIGHIRTYDGINRYSDKCGLQLITGEKTKERENIGKMIGLKNKVVILCADELPELSPALIEVAITNLVSNPVFQMIGSGNFKGIFDSFGQFTTPKRGWNSITTESTRWETTNGGVCLRFDGLKSPNILRGEDIYPIYGNATLAKHRVSLGENTSGFWRMVRSYPCPDADANRIYSEADFIKGRVNEKCLWARTPVRVASLDPAFASGGDKAIAYFGSYGMCIDGKQRLCYDERIEIREDVRRLDENRALQVAKQYRDLCVSKKVLPENAAFDFSGGGIVFGALLSEVWSSKCYGVQFGGAPTMRPVSVKDNRPGKDAYTHRVAEIWFSGLEFVQSDQIRGLDGEAAKQLKERRYDTVKGANGLKMRVEKKDEMKARMNESPDSADSALILLDLCRERFGFIAGGIEGKAVSTRNSWQTKVKEINSVYSEENMHSEEEVAA